MTRAEAKAFITAFVVMRENAGDALASKAIHAYPKLKQHETQVPKTPLIKAGTRINWNGTIKKAAVDLWDTLENNPDNAPPLWVDIAYREGYRIIPTVITVLLAFALGECGWGGDILYRSKVAANVYTPEQNPDGWEVVNDS